ncbi:MAG: MFS transporter [Armatimonadetes bacterium]|nr:MFS transporter [Armatimonadota bacterium]
MPQAQAQDTRLVHFWRNLAVNICIEGLWGFAMACTSLMTVVAALLKELRAPGMVIGALPAAATVGAVLTQIPGACVFRRLRRRKWAFIAALMPIGGLWVVAGFTIRAVAPQRPGLATALLILLVGLSSMAGGFILPAWYDFINRMLPPSRRGRALGMMGASLASMTLLGGLYAAAVLRQAPGYVGFSILFIVAGILMLAASLGYAPAVEAELGTGGPFGVSDAWRLLRDPRSPCTRLITTRWAIELSRAPLIFATILTLSRFDLPAAYAGILSFLMALGHAAAAPFGGWLGDHRGHKASMLVACAIAPAGTLLVLLAPHPWIAFAGFVLLGCIGIGDLALANLIIETAPEADKNMYTAMVETLMLPPRLVGPVAAGAVAQFVSPVVALATAAVLQVGAIAAVAKLIVEPREHLPHFLSAPYARD